MSAWQKDVRVVENEVQRLPHFRNAQHFFADVRVKAHRPAVTLDNLDNLFHRFNDAKRKQRRPHHMEVLAVLQKVIPDIADRQLPRSAVSYVKDKIAFAVLPVCDKSATR